jgi:hypothetical protein
MARSKFVQVLFLQRTEDVMPMPSGNMYLVTRYINTEFWNNHTLDMADHINHNKNTLSSFSPNNIMYAVWIDYPLLTTIKHM